MSNFRDTGDQRIIDSLRSENFDLYDQLAGAQAKIIRQQAALDAVEISRLAILEMFLAFKAKKVGAFIDAALTAALSKAEVKS